MKVIGHRGAAGLALENTLGSIRAAVKAGVDAIEIDIRVTKDGELVLSHDRHLGRVSQAAHRVDEHSLKSLKSVKLHDGQAVATLEEALKAAGDTPVVIEGKDSGWARPLADFLKPRKDQSMFSVISFDHQELYTFKTLLPSVPTYALEHTNPLEVVRTARIYGFSGIDLNFWILNPLTYLLARFYKLRIIVYTVNKPWLASFLRLLYPRISITTDVPHQLQFLRPKQRRVTRKRRRPAGKSPAKKS